MSPAPDVHRVLPSAVEPGHDVHHVQEFQVVRASRLSLIVRMIVSAAYRAHGSGSGRHSTIMQVPPNPLRLVQPVSRAVHESGGDESKRRTGSNR
jgi:hypothetical protein